MAQLTACISVARGSSVVFVVRVIYGHELIDMRWCFFLVTWWQRFLVGIWDEVDNGRILYRQNQYDRLVERGKKIGGGEIEVEPFVKRRLKIAAPHVMSFVYGMSTREPVGHRRRPRGEAAMSDSDVGR